MYLWSKAAFSVIPVPVDAVEYGEEWFLFKKCCLSKVLLVSQTQDACAHAGRHEERHACTKRLSRCQPFHLSFSSQCRQGVLVQGQRRTTTRSSPSPAAKSRSANSPRPPIGDGCTATDSCSGHCGTGYSSSSSCSSSGSTSPLFSCAIVAACILIRRSKNLKYKRNPLSLFY
jgi:hypothetical protein